MTQREFDNIFGRTWYRKEGDYFTFIMMATLLFVFFGVIYLASIDFDTQKIHEKIATRYQKFIIENLRKESFTEFIEQPIEKEEPEFIYIKPREKAGSGRESITKDLTESGILNDSAPVNPYVDLPTADIADMEFEELTSDVSTLPPTRFFERSKQNRADYQKKPGEDLLRDPYEYKIYRDANLYLEMPEYLAEEKGEKEVRGYRNQNEIMRVIYSKSNIIESCYQKALRKNMVNSGYVKVEFKISPNGHVLPGSINIINSTIRNRLVEQCIKKNIRRWRDFEKLNENMGIAHVVHKFVFN